jgi:hypothetical protein
LCNKAITLIELIAAVKRDLGFKAGEWPAHFDATAPRIAVTPRDERRTFTAFI